MDLNKLTIQEAHNGLIQKKFSAKELVGDCLEVIKKNDKKINSFITICDKEALADAEKVDKKIKSGQKISFLEGVPFGVKDAICTRGVRSTAAAKILDNYIPPYDATVIKKIKDQGGILIGKQNCDAFGHGASNENSDYGSVKNPWNTKKVPGGSSGGSAAATASDMCVYSIGEDTGGSIRQPAGYCSVVGLKPSYGRNSRYGIMPMASSLDVPGPITKNVFDAAAVMEVMAGRDKRDSTTVGDKVPAYTKELKKNIKNLKIGIPKEYFEYEINSQTKKIIEKAIKNFEEMGANIKEISLPHTEYAVPVYYIVVPSEDSSNMARIDAIRYGQRKKSDNLFDLYAESRKKGLPDEVKRRIMMGTYSLSSGYYDDYYLKAQKARTLIIEDFNNAFLDIDVIITPTSPKPPFDLGERKDDPIAMYLSDVFVCPASLAGLNAISIPAGFTNDNLPVGMQIMGPRLKEDLILRAAYNFEQATEHHKKKCKL